MTCCFNKLADWEFDQDRIWGVSPRWAGDSEASNDGIYGEDWMFTSQYMPGYTDSDKMLVGGMLSPDQPMGFAALNIYRQLVRSIIFNKQDPTSLQLQQRYKGLSASIRTRLAQLEKQNPRVYKFLSSSGRFGETLIGSELDNMLLSGTFDELADRVNAIELPDDKDSEGYLKSLFVKDIKDNWTPEKVQKRKDTLRKLTHTYAFSRYAPGMALAAATPFTLGALMGRPGLGLLLGAALSGGVGYYGYNRLNNTMKPIPWLDTLIGVDSQKMTPQAQSVWDDYNYDGPLIIASTPEEEERLREQYYELHPDEKSKAPKTGAPTNKTVPGF